MEKHWSFRSNSVDFDFARIMREAQEAGAEIVEVTRGPHRVLLVRHAYAQRMCAMGLVSWAPGGWHSNIPQDKHPYVLSELAQFSAAKRWDNHQGLREGGTEAKLWCKLATRGGSDDCWLHAPTARGVHAELLRREADVKNALVRTTVVCFGGTQ